MRGTIPSFPQYAFLAWCLVKHGDNFAFTFTLNFTYVYILYINQYILMQQVT
jgi:hypothetical protein